MWQYIEQLKEPSLVAAIQNKFGVRDRPNVKNQYSNGDAVPKLKHNKNIADEGTNHADISSALKTDQLVDDYIIDNKFWYYLFLVGTALGDEIFYASFIPFWFWNVDGAVGRRVVCVWTIVMYVGQGIKDIVRWPRPSYPAKRLQKKWAEEYGMPSTHAMVGVSLPFSVVLYTMNRYIYSKSLGVALSLTWCSVICVSRVYLGMHTVLDIVAGLVLALMLMIPMVPLVDYLDSVWLTSLWSPVILLAVAVLVIVYFPHTDRWTPTRGDTTMIISVCAGIHIGAWTNYQLGNMVPYPQQPPYAIIWPNLQMLGLGAIRTILGFSLVLATRNISKLLAKTTLCALLHLDSTQLKNTQNSSQRNSKTFVELACKFTTYFSIGFNTVYSIPTLFRFCAIERPTFYTEI